MSTSPSITDLNTFSGVETIVGDSLKIEGDLTSDGDIRIDGEVIGKISTKGSVIIGPEADIKANISCKSAQIDGKVEGDIVVTERLSLGESARVKGNIESSALEIKQGAQFSGNSVMSGSKVESESNVQTAKPKNLRDKISKAQLQVTV